MESFWLSREWIQRASLRLDATWPVWQLTAELRNTAGQTIALRGRGGGDRRRGDRRAQRRLAADGAGARRAHRDGRHPDARRVAGGPTGGAERACRVGCERPGRARPPRRQRRSRRGGDARPLGGHHRAARRGGAAARLGWRPTRAGRSPSTESGTTPTSVRLLAADADIRASSSGTLRVTLPLGDPDQFDATVAVQRLQVVSGPYELASERPAADRVPARRRAGCTSSRCAAPTPNSAPAAGLGRAVRSSCRLTGDGDLRLLELAGETVESARGRFTVDADGSPCRRPLGRIRRVARRQARRSTSARRSRLTRVTGRLDAGGQRHPDRRAERTHRHRHLRDRRQRRS